MNSWLGYVELVIIRDTLWFGYADACHKLLEDNSFSISYMYRLVFSCFFFFFCM